MDSGVISLFSQLAQSFPQSNRILLIYSQSMQCGVVSRLLGRHKGENVRRRGAIHKNVHRLPDVEEVLTESIFNSLSLFQRPMQQSFPLSHLLPDASLAQIFLLDFLNPQELRELRLVCILVQHLIVFTWRCVMDGMSLSCGHQCGSNSRFVRSQSHIQLTQQCSGMSPSLVQGVSEFCANIKVKSFGLELDRGVKSFG
jgi:hypothetical protein